MWKINFTWQTGLEALAYVLSYIALRYEDAISNTRYVKTWGIGDDDILGLCIWVQSIHPEYIGFK